MPRALFILTAASSAILWAATCALWVRSSFHADELYRQSVIVRTDPGGKSVGESDWFLLSSSGTLACYHYSTVAAPVWDGPDAGSLDWGLTRDEFRGAKRLEAAGIEVDRHSRVFAWKSGATGGSQFLFVLLPLWAIAATVAVPPAVWAVLTLRRRRTGRGFSAAPGNGATQRPPPSDSLSG